MGEVGKTAVVQLVSNSDCTGWAISMLCQNEVRFAGSWVISLKCIGPVQEYYHIRVLFNAARLTKISEHRPLVRALLRAPVELADRHDRDLELLGQELDLSGKLADLLLTGFHLAAGGHQLQVIENHQPEVVALLQATRL